MTKRLIHSWDNQKVDNDDEEEDEEGDDDSDDDNSAPQDWHLLLSLKMWQFLITLFGVFMRQNINLDDFFLQKTKY